MNYMPKINRRSFVVTSAAWAAGSRSASTFRSAPRVVRAADGAPELNAWVVIKPDDTVVIRIARSEMGQGTLTGLAQLVAEELRMRLVEGRRPSIRPRGRTSRASASGATSGPAAAAASAQSQDYVRKGGAPPA